MNGKDADSNDFAGLADASHSRAFDETDFIAADLYSASINDSIIIIDAKGLISQMNSAAEAITGWALAEAAGRPLSEVFRIVYAPRLQPTHEFELMIDRDVFGMANDMGLLARDGSEFQISHYSASPIRDAGHRIIGTVITFRDVTAEHSLQQALASAKEMLLHTGDLARIGGWSVDLRSMKLFWSAETFRIYGLEATVAPTWEQAVNYYAPAARKLIQAMLEQTMTHGTPWDLELPLCNAKGVQLWIRVQGSAIIENGKPIKVLGAIQDITSRRTSEGALRVTGAALRAVSQGVLIADTEERVVFANPAFTQISGYQESEILGRDCQFLQGPRTDPATVRAIRDCLDRHEEYSGEILNYRKDGSTFWNELNISCVLDTDGQLTHFIAVTRDITGRRLAEHELRENELQMRLAVQGANLGVWDWDAPSGRLSVNGRWKEMLGLDADGPMPTIEYWHSLVHPDDLPRLQYLVNEVILNPQGRQVDVEIRARHQRGHWIWIHDLGRVVDRAADGSPLRVVGTHMDISTRKNAEEAAQRSIELKDAADLKLLQSETAERMRLHRILDDVAAYAIAFNPEGRILHVSSQLLTRAGFDSKDLVGRPLAALLGDAQAQLAIAESLEQQQAETAVVQELRAQDGSWWPVYMRVSLPSGGGRLLVGRDREAEVAAEARLQRLHRLTINAQELLSAESEKRQHLELAFLDIAEREQARIGQELHDDVGQQLAGIAFLGRALTQRLQLAKRTESQDADWIAQLLSKTLDSLRAISRDLSPGGLESGDLAKSLRSLCERSERLHGVACGVRVDAAEGAIAALTPVLSLNLFRIAQEALNNALRHGSPRSIGMLLRLRETSGSLSVRNDGPGFDVNQATEGIGLRNILIRTRGFKGRSRVCSGANGTLVVVQFPRPDALPKSIE
jgi:PAS domain S-box-containing protein